MIFFRLYIIKMMTEYIVEYQIEKLLAWVLYSVGLWIFCRYWHGNFSKKRNPIQIENIVSPSISTERLKTERLITENRQLKAENEQLKGNSDQQKAEIEQLKTELEQWKKWGRNESEHAKTLKNQNDILFETLNKTNKERELDLEKEAISAMTEKPENDFVFDSGATTGEIDAMVQVMKGRPLFPKVQNQAVHAIQKTQGTDLYHQLMDRIDGAKQQVEEALNETKQPDQDNINVDDEDWKNFDINKYV